MKVLSKVKVFFWRACSDALPTKVNLKKKKRKVLDNSVCELCGCREESTLHAIWDCEQVRMIWLPSFTDVWTKPQSIDSLCYLVGIIMAERKNLEEFAMTAWLIWVQRKKMRTNEPALPSLKLAQSASTLLAEFQHGKQHQLPKVRSGPMRWQPPPVGTMKANFDGVVFGAD